MATIYKYEVEVFSKYILDDRLIEQFISILRDRNLNVPPFVDCRYIDASFEDEGRKVLFSYLSQQEISDAAYDNVWEEFAVHCIDSGNTLLGIGFGKNEYTLLKLQLKRKEDGTVRSFAICNPPPDLSDPEKMKIWFDQEKIRQDELQNAELELYGKKDTSSTSIAEKICSLSLSLFQQTPQISSLHHSWY